VAHADAGLNRARIRHEFHGSRFALHASRPESLLDLVTSTDVPKARRAMEAMMTMCKIDIAALEQAVAA
jgi:hypothetical protein